MEKTFGLADKSFWFLGLLFKFQGGEGVGEGSVVGIGVGEGIVSGEVVGIISKVGVGVISGVGVGVVVGVGSTVIVGVKSGVGETESDSVGKGVIEVVMSWPYTIPALYGNKEFTNKEIVIRPENALLHKFLFKRTMCIMIVY